jgi:hypothetical protein
MSALWPFFDTYDDGGGENQSNGPTRTGGLKSTGWLTAKAYLGDWVWYSDNWSTRSTAAPPQRSTPPRLSIKTPVRAVPMKSIYKTG